MSKIGNPIPSFTNVEIEQTKGDEAVRIYQESGRVIMEWQQMQLAGIMATNPDDTWKYMVYCISLSRRNGKGEVLVAREMYGLTVLGEKICHTAHRTTTSHDAFTRLYTLLQKAGYEEHSRKQKVMPERSFFASKQYGLEHIEITGGGIIDFRTRTNNGGLGEGFDLLVIDEAQEYTSKEKSALSYTISASMNPQTILVGTPPTATSGGDVFLQVRKSVIDGKASDTGWSEWGIPELTDDIENTDLWYKYNPSLGITIPERNVRQELTNDPVDFNIQRLGLWVSYSQKSAISKGEWRKLQSKKMPKLSEARYLGIKYGRDGSSVAVAIASKTEDGRVFVESIDCRSVREGNQWLFDYIKNPKVQSVAVDGASGQKLLVDDLKEAKIRCRMILPTVAEIITANTMFEQAISQETICHMGQVGLEDVVSNCEHRPIGSKGGFGYKSLTEDLKIEILDSVILAFWQCSVSKDKPKKQSISY